MSTRTVFFMSALVCIFGIGFVSVGVADPPPPTGKWLITGAGDYQAFRDSFVDLKYMVGGGMSALGVCFWFGVNAVLARIGTERAGDRQHFDDVIAAIIKVCENKHNTIDKVQQALVETVADCCPREKK